MPGGDRTGPMGDGPFTGRGAGFCAGNDRPGYAEPSFGGYGRGRGLGLGLRGGRGFARGFRGGFGQGWGRGSGFRANALNFDDFTPANYASQPVDEKEYLKQAAENLKKNLADIQTRLNKLSDEE